MEKRNLDEVTVRILAINGSNRKNSNSGILLEYALEDLKKEQNVEVEILHTYNKKYGREEKEDDFLELLEKWNRADGILLILPNYTVGGPGNIYSAFDRLTEALENDIRGGIYKKAAGVLVQGSNVYGMAELAMESTFEVLAGLHVFPVFRLPAHIPDGEKPGQQLLESVHQMTRETVEGARLIKAAAEIQPEREAVVLILNAGIDDPEIGNGIEDRVKKRLEAKEGIRTEVFRFAGEKLADCHHCNQLCRKTFRCAFQDAFQDFFDKWIRADGLIWITSANQAGPPAEVHDVHDRLSETGFSTVSDRAKRLGVPYRFCRYTKPEAVVSYGKYSYGGQTLSQQFFVNVAEQRGNYYVSGRMPASLGPAALLRQPTQLGCDQRFTEDVDHLTDDVADLARRIQTAKAAFYETLPELYYNSRTQMGIPDKEGYLK